MIWKIKNKIHFICLNVFFWSFKKLLIHADDVDDDDDDDDDDNDIVITLAHN